MHVSNYLSYTFLFIQSRQQLKQSGLVQYNCKLVKLSEMKSPNSRNAPKRGSQVTSNSDGSSSTVSVCDLDVVVGTSNQTNVPFFNPIMTSHYGQIEEEKLSRTKHLKPLKCQSAVDSSNLKVNKIPK